MSTFHFPYRARIIGQLTVAGITHAPTEIYRTHKVLSEMERKFQIRDFGPEWDTWVEHTTRENWVLGSHRPIPARTGYTGPVPVGLLPEEHDQLEAAGIEPVYKAAL